MLIRQGYKRNFFKIKTLLACLFFNLTFHLRSRPLMFACSSNERTRLFIFIKFMKKNLRKKIVDRTKVSKAIEENVLTVTIKWLLLELNLYWEFMCTGKNNGSNKTDLLSSPFHSSYSFLNCWKLREWIILYGKLDGCG